MTQITMVIDGPESGRISEQVSSTLFALVAQGNVVLRKFEMNELLSDPGWRGDGTEIKVPEFLQGRNQKTAETGGV